MLALANESARTTEHARLYSMNEDGQYTQMYSANLGGKEDGRNTRDVENN